MQYQEHIPLAEFTSMRVGGEARYFCGLTEVSDVAKIFTLARKLGVEPFFLGDGSNTIFADGVINKLVVKNDLKGVTFNQDEDRVLATVAAGEDWDDFVAQSAERGFAGVEALSGIPGTVGAAPVQNIGAYGQELSDVFVSAEVWDAKQEKRQTLEKSACDFSYRDSRFKVDPGRFLILNVTMELSAEPPTTPDYGSLQSYLKENDISDPNLDEIREAVLAVRSRRLPDIAKLPNAGSFFTNPIISTAQANKLQKQFPDLVRFDLEGGQTKVPAGWLIEQAGLKGKRFGNFSTSADNALVLIHDGGSTTAELLEVERKIKRKVKDKFGITLEREPNLVT